MKKFLLLLAFAFLFAGVAYAEEAVVTSAGDTTGSNGTKIEDKVKKMEERLKELKEKQSKAKETKKEDLACVKLAVTKREVTLQSAFSTFSTSMNTALSTRQIALESSYDVTERSARVKARNDAWAGFKTSSKTAHTTLKTARKAAYDAFKADSKACSSTYSESAPMSGIDQISL